MASKFLDSPGITHLWEQIKALIGGKVDKVSSSTDNAVVRFNGTSGDIQNSGVTINDSNHLTAAKLITSGGTSSQFVKGDGSLDSTSYVNSTDAIKNADYIVSNAVIMTDTIKKRIYDRNTQDSLWAANSRFVVTHKKYSSTDDSLLGNVSADVFKGHFESSANNVYDGEYAILYIGNVAEDELSSTTTAANGIFTYPNGKIFMTFYSSMRCGEILEAKGWFRNDSAWRNLTVVANNTTVYEIQIPNVNYLKAVRIKYSGSNLGSEKKTSLTDVAYIRFRDTINERNLITKYPTAQRMYGNLTAPKFITSGGTSSQFVKGDGSLDSNTYVKTSDLKVTTNTNIGIDAPGTNAIGYVSGLTRADWNYQQVDGSLYTQFYNSNWINEIFQDFRTGQLSIRSRNNGTWLPWRRVLDETNATTILGLNTYAPLASPALTGTPTAPTAAAGTNTTQIATTEFVQNTLSNNLASYNITLNGTFPEGWYRVAKLGSCFSGIVYLVGTYTSARPTVATFAISGKATNVGCDIIQLSGTAVSGGVSKIRLVSGEDGDSTFYLDMYKATSVNISTTYFTFSGMYYDLENAVSTTVLNTASTYVRKVCDIKTITEDMYVTTSTFNEEIGTLNDEIATLTDGTTSSESGNVIDIGEYDLMKINEVKGKSLVMNQLVNPKTTTVSFNGISVTFNETHYSVVGTATSGGGRQNNLLKENIHFIEGHKYLLWKKAITDTQSAFDGVVWTNNASTHRNFIAVDNRIYTSGSTVDVYIGLNITQGTVYDHDLYVSIVDLTQMFGAGNEPTTVEEVEAILGNDYYEYNTGEVVGNSVEKLDVTGFNIWDEEWENGYFYVSGTGNYTETKGNSSTCILSANFIPVLPNSQYCASIQKSNAYIYKVAYFDENKNFLSMAEGDGANIKVFTTVSNCRYIKFYTEAYSPYYLNDICVNISNSVRNGTYEPYKHNEFPLNLTELTGKVGGEWNQLVDYTRFTKYGSQAIDLTITGTTIQVSSTSSSAGIECKYVAAVAGHKYFVRFDYDLSNFNAVVYYRCGNSSSSLTGGTTGRVKAVIRAYNTNYPIIWSNNYSGSFSWSVSNYIIVDLTQMFGAGNEPSSAICDIIFPNDYYPYNIGEVNSDDISGIIFPDGLHGVGTAYDSLIVDEDGYARRAIKRMGSRAYASGDESDTSVITDNTNTYYPLATPIEYVLDTPVQCVVPVSKNGTVKQVPVMPDSTPMVMDVTYLHDTGGVIGGLIGNYATKDYVDTQIGNIETLLASI